jgi:hypothetical protein
MHMPVLLTGQIRLQLPRSLCLQLAVQLAAQGSQST